MLSHVCFRIFAIYTLVLVCDMPFEGLLPQASLPTVEEAACARWRLRSLCWFGIFTGRMLYHYAAVHWLQERGRGGGGEEGRKEGREEGRKGGRGENEDERQGMENGGETMDGT